MIDWLRGFPPFIKAQSIGGDFLLMHPRGDSPPPPPASFMKELCASVGQTLGTLECGKNPSYSLTLETLCSPCSTVKCISRWRFTAVKERGALDLLHETKREHSCTIECRIYPLSCFHKCCSINCNWNVSNFTAPPMQHTVDSLINVPVSGCWSLQGYALISVSVPTTKASVVCQTVDGKGSLIINPWKLKS